MHKVENAVNKLSYALVKINRSNSYEYVKNKVKNLGIIQEKNLNLYAKSPNFKKVLNKDDWILQHPVLAKQIGETTNTKIYKIITLTHSPYDININNEIVKKTKVGSYEKDGKQVDQYATNASCLIEVENNDPNVTIKNVSNDPEEIKKLGGKENFENIIRKLDYEWETKPTYEYINYLKNTVIKDYEKYEKNLELDQENKTKPEEE